MLCHILNRLILYQIMSSTSLEYWLRGPIPGVPNLMQPVAHALLQANDEVKSVLVDFPAEKLWQKPGGAASVGFHLQHMAGVIDRMFTYADSRQLSAVQLAYLAREGEENDYIDLITLLTNLELNIERFIRQLKTVDESRLHEPRGVGRKQLPSTVIGLLFHAAEHSMRHTGQLIVTVKMLKAG
jgi:uncharacterized damage-inducible protein DinB